MPVLAQENYISGYILKLNGDTLKGLVDYRNWAKNPNIIRFKITTADNVREFKPLDIAGFGAKDEIYKSAVVKVDGSSKNGIISESPMFSFRTDTAFLQTFYQGSKSLYFYKDRNDQDNFYIYNNSVYELLEYKKYIKKGSDEHEFLTENKRYVGQLLVYLQDCKNIDVKLKKIAYTDKSLQSLFEYYYSQKKTETVVKRTNEKFKLEFGIVAGISMIDLRFVSASSVFDPLPKAKFGNTLSPVGGLSLNVVIPRNNGKWSIYNELFYNSYNTTAVYNDFHSAEYYDIHYYKVGYAYGKINNMLRFKYPLKNAFIFVNAGLSNGFILHETNVDSITRRYNGVTTTRVQKIVADGGENDTFSAKKHELGFLVGFGGIYKKFSAEFRLEAGTGFSKYIALDANANRYNLLFGYRF
jgi:hypothetical protein